MEATNTGACVFDRSSCPHDFLSGILGISYLYRFEGYKLITGGNILVE